MPWELLLASPVVIALIGIVVALIQRPRLNRIETAAKAAQDQVENDHDSNLREDVDRVEAKTDRLGTSVDRIESKVDRLTDLLSEHLISAEQSDTTASRRVQQIVDRLSDLSTRVRRVESRRPDRQEP